MSQRTLGTVLAVAVAASLGGLALLAFDHTLHHKGLPLSDAGVIRQQASKKHLDPALIAAVIYAETKFDARPSPAGAQGLMQILPQTAEFLAHRSGATTFTTADLATPAVIIAYGSYYLRYLIDQYGGRRTPAFAAYNGGEANVSRWVAEAHANGHPLRIRDIPFPETR